MDESKYLRKQWYEFHRSKPILPLHTEGNDLPSRSERTTPYCFTIERADNIVVPAQLTRDIEEDFHIVHRFNLSLFHPPSKSFFGNTFVGGAFPPSSTNKDPLVPGKTFHNVEYNQKTFFHTTVIDKNCVAVIELVAIGMIPFLIIIN